MKNKLFLIIVVAIFNALNIFALEFAHDQKPLWKPVGLMSEAERVGHLTGNFSFISPFKMDPSKALEGFKAAFRQGKISTAEVKRFFCKPAIHTVLLPEFGQAFAFDGSVDTRFTEELKNRQREPLTILIPAFGLGRSVLDALTIHQSATIIANDWQSVARTELEKLLGTYDVDGSRISFLMGDILEKLEELDPSSVDIVYVANLIHFFSPQQLVEFFAKLSKVLKPQAKVFLGWKSPGYKHFEQCSEMLRKLGCAYPNYIGKDDFSDTKNLPPLPYYNVEVEDIVLSAQQFYFTPTEQGVDYLVCCSVNFEGQPIAIGDYKILSQAPTEEYPATRYVVLNFTQNENDAEARQDIFVSSDQQGTISIEKRAEHLEQFRCHHCKNPCEKLYQCSKCSKAKYCGRTCQVAAWPAHKGNCK